MNEYEILLNGDIDWEITARGVREHLASAGGKDLNIKLSSDGGYVSEATVIRNDIIAYMKNNNAKVNFELVGWVQSAGSYLTTIAGATVSISPDILYMYHNPLSYAVGDYTVMDEQSVLLKALAETYANAYALKSGTKKDDILEGMRATTYLIGQEIIDAGFADTMIESPAGNDEEPEMKSRDLLVSMSKQRFSKTNDRLVAAAFGGSDSRDLENKKNKNEQVVAPKKKDTEMSKKDEDDKTPVVDDKARAKACMKAQGIMTEEHDALSKHFDAGMSADFFNGMIANAEMKIAKDKELIAKGESPDDVDPKEPVVDDDEPVMKSTQGRSGQTTEVGK